MKVFWQLNNIIPLYNNQLIKVLVPSFFLFPFSTDVDSDTVNVPTQKMTIKNCVYLPLVFNIICHTIKN